MTTFEGQSDKERSGQTDDPLLTVPPPAQQQAAADDTESALADLKRQLEEERAQRRLDQEARRAAEEDAGRQRQAAQQSHLNSHQANLAAVSRALEGNVTLMASLRQEYRAALEAADYDRAATIQEKMSEAAARKIQLETGKAQLESAASRPQPQQQAPSDPFEAAVARYTPRTQNFIRQHPELLRDPKLGNLAQAAHFKAVANGHVADSDAYFDALEQELGYKGAQQQQQQSNGRRQMAAPPARSSTPGARQSQAMGVRDMTPKMLQLARESDMKPEEWLAAYNEGVASGDVVPFH